MRLVTLAATTTATATIWCAFASPALAWTIRGTSPADVLVGVDDRDEQMRGLAGDDIMRGNAGDDWMSAGAGNDVVRGR